ncbi:MAG: creatininase family protein [Rhizobiaceae bacterium]
MTASEISALPEIVVLPLGATEQHGAHLPLETDTIIATGVAGRLREALPNSSKVRFEPVEPVGYSPEHLDFPGSRSLSYDEAIERWIGIGRQAAERGMRKFVMLNAHGGNSPLMTIVATELRVRHGMLAVATSWTRFGYPPDLVSEEERAIGIHGGFIETAVMLALRPDLVDMKKARDFPSAQSRFARDFQHLRAYGPHAFGWKMGDLSKDGVVGNAAAASAEVGERILDQAVAGLAALMADVERFDMAALR